VRACSSIHMASASRPPTRPPAPMQIEAKANVCAAKWRPGSTHELAVGSADHCTYLFDMRNTSSPVCALAGHRCGWVGRWRGGGVGDLG
jgi:hypothetical protein